MREKKAEVVSEVKEGVEAAALPMIDNNQLKKPKKSLRKKLNQLVLSLAVLDLPS